MGARNTDKLFRDKLKNAESIPTSDSWDKLESLLDQEKKPLFSSFWYIAAVISLLIVSGFVFYLNYNQQESKKEIASIDINSESMEEKNTIVPIEDQKAKNEETEVISETIVEKPLQKLKIEKKPINSPSKTKLSDQKHKKEENNSLQESIQILAVSEEVQAPIIEETLQKENVEEPKRKKDFKSIKITYKRGNKSLPNEDEMLAEQEVDSIGGNKIKELWQQTKEIKPGDVWADIRDAKDNLFQRNSKKNNVKNLNK